MKVKEFELYLNKTYELTPKQIEILKQQIEMVDIITKKLNEDE